MLNKGSCQRSLVRAIVLTSLTFLQSAQMYGQVARASVTGIVQDATGAVFPGAAVTAINVQTQVRYATTTNDAGNYMIGSLPVGEYSVIFTGAGFKEFVRSGLNLSSGQIVRLDVVLEVGQVTDKISVTAEAPLLQTETTQVSKGVGSTVFSSLPLSFSSSGRNMADFAAQLVPGVVGSRWDMRIQGTPSASQAIIIDGMNNLSMLPGDFAEDGISPEAIEELSVVTGNQSAEGAQAAGGSLNFILKSGTNQFHGNAFFYLRNEILNANDWNNNRLLAADPDFTNPTTASFLRPKHRRFDKGFSGGGPVIIPKLYNGKDKTFFYFTYERFTNNSQGPSTLQKSVPQPEMWDGDLSRLLTGKVVGTDILGRQVVQGQIYDPTSLRQVNGQYVADPFIGNIIPVSRFSKVAAGFKPIFNQYYQPVTGDLNNNLYFTNYGSQVVQQGTIKVDHSISSKHKASGFYTWNSAPRDYQNAGGLWSLSDPTGGGPLSKSSVQNRRGYHWNVNEDWIVAPNVLNHASVGVNFTGNSQWDRRLGKGDSAAWGIKGVGAGFKEEQITPTAFNLGSSPLVTFESWGDAENLDRQYWGYMLDDTLSWQRRSHSIKLGLSAHRLRSKYANYGNTGGTFSFASRTTGIPGQSYSSYIGNSFASFLLGQVDSSSMFTDFNPYAHRDALSVFIQDSWKVTPQLTLNLGLNWGGTTPIYEDEDRMASFNPLLSDPKANGMLGAVEYLGTGEGRSGRRSVAPGDWKDFAPTFGFAYRIAQRTVLRGAYGITYTPESIVTTAGWGSPIVAGFAAGFQPQNSVLADSKGIYLPTSFLDDGYTGAPTPANLDPSWAQTHGSTMVSPKYTLAGYVQQFNFGIQHEIRRDLLIEAEWRGNKGTRLHAGGLVIPNQIHEADLARGSVLGNVINSPASAAAAGLPYPYPGWSGIGANTLEPFPQIKTQSLQAWEDPVGFSTYHSGNLIVTKRMSQGFSLYGAYTFGKMIGNVSDVMGKGTATGFQDTYNRGVYKSVDPTDRTHVFKGSFTWDLPVGKGQALLTNANGLLDRLLGGWTVAGILNYQSATPLGAPGALATPVGWNGPGVYSNFSTPSGGFKRVFDADKFNPWNANDPGNRFFDPTAFSNPLPQTLGNSPVRFPQVRGLWNFTENAALLKHFSIWERARFELRLELFNAFNRHYIGGPDMNRNNSYFGNVRTASGGRSGQFDMRIEF
jgi:hypothetical protein